MSASKLLANLPPQLAALVAPPGSCDDSCEPEESSILDVNDDQLFDNSIFTEYDESNLSSVATASHTAKSWKQARWVTFEFRRLRQFSNCTFSNCQSAVLIFSF